MCMDWNLDNCTPPPPPPLNPGGGAGKAVVLAGDMNVGHLDADIYNHAAKHISKQAGLTPQERASFSQMLGSGLRDAFRHFYPG